ncbi:MAG: hypothetical protein JNJ46_10095 [Myxococcales bacterium]|nr:hypothetical protein [Myxococcales bacterium]
MYGLYVPNTSDILLGGNCGGSNGPVWLYNGGLNPGLSCTMNNIRGMWGSGTTDAYAWVTTANGGIGKPAATANGGLTPIAVTSPTNNSLNGVWGINIGDVWAVGGNGTILHYQP